MLLAGGMVVPSADALEVGFDDPESGSVVVESLLPLEPELLVLPELESDEDEPVLEDDEPDDEVPEDDAGSDDVLPDNAGEDPLTVVAGLLVDVVPVEAVLVADAVVAVPAPPLVPVPDAVAGSLAELPACELPLPSPPPPPPQALRTTLPLRAVRQPRN